MSLVMSLCSRRGCYFCVKHFGFSPSVHCHLFVSSEVVHIVWTWQTLNCLILHAWIPFIHLSYCPLWHILIDISLANLSDRLGILSPEVCNTHFGVWAMYNTSPLRQNINPVELIYISYSEFAVHLTLAFSPSFPSFNDDCRALCVLGCTFFVWTSLADKSLSVEHRMLHAQHGRTQWDREKLTDRQTDRQTLPKHQHHQPNQSPASPAGLTQCRHWILHANPMCVFDGGCGGFSRVEYPTSTTIPIVTVVVLGVRR